ncbi:hypothetical protein N8T08_003025 [Aspergillus melleus]|uniref:Uncharacterized protein n=1 Tax=Aspergillus melleus TaxID=138277 RepID=A0ACC3B805_9EURO|nr:hypothetical protein N8T08_003025 [Aspergillus melleus]
MAYQGNIPVFYVSRIVSGLGVGASTFVVPQYLSECAPPAARGGIIGCFEIGTQIGAITGFWINYGVQQMVSMKSSFYRFMTNEGGLEIDPQGDKQWFIPIAFQFIPAGLMAMGLFFLSESPRWFYAKHRVTEAATALAWLRQLPSDHPYMLKELNDYQRQMELETDLAPTDNLWAIMKESFTPRMLPRSVGWNIPWIIAAEIFPTRIRSFCLVLTTCSHWLGEFYTSYAVTYMFHSITYGTFIFFGTMTVIGGIYVFLLVPETNGVALEDMDYLFGGKSLAVQKMRRFRERQLEAEVLEGRSATPTEEELADKEMSVS